MSLRASKCRVSWSQKGASRSQKWHRCQDLLRSLYLELGLAGNSVMFLFSSAPVCQETICRWLMVKDNQTALSYLCQEYVCHAVDSKTNQGLISSVNSFSIILSVYIELLKPWKHNTTKTAMMEVRCQRLINWSWRMQLQNRQTMINTNWLNGNPYRRLAVAGQIFSPGGSQGTGARLRTSSVA